MKSLSKIFLIVIVAFVANNVNAQEKFSFGVNAGATLSDMLAARNPSVNTPFGRNSYGLTFGYTFGVTVDYNLTDNFFIQSGLSFITKGSKDEYTVTIMTEILGGTYYSELHKHKNQSLYLQLPIYAGYKFQVAESVKLLFNVGPYFAYGIGGKTKSEWKPQGGSGVSGSDKKDTFGDDGLKRFDCGLGFGAGVEFGKIGVNAAYYLGLIGVHADNSSVTLKNRSFALTVSYKF